MVVVFYLQYLRDHRRYPPAEVDVEGCHALRPTQVTNPLPSLLSTIWSGNKCNDPFYPGSFINLVSNPKG